MERRGMQDSQTRPRVLIADDHSMVAERLRSLLERSCDVIGVVENGQQLLSEGPRLKPDVVVLDINMPLLNGLEAAERLKQTLPKAKFVFLTASADHSFVEAVLKVGPVGYVLKSHAGSELRTAILEVLQDRAYVTAKLLRRKPDDRPRVLLADDHPSSLGE
jgi:DNA-binding NarL/FixJ family response regulator